MEDGGETRVRSKNTSALPPPPPLLSDSPPPRSWGRNESWLADEAGAPEQVSLRSRFLASAAAVSGSDIVGVSSPTLQCQMQLRRPLWTQEGSQDPLTVRTTSPSCCDFEAIVDGSARGA